MTTNFSIPAPDPLRRRLALPKGAKAVATLEVTIPFRPDQARFEAVARSVIDRIPAFRLRLEHLPGISAPSICVGEAPEVRFVWQPQAAYVASLPDGHCVGDDSLGGTRIEIRIEPGVSANSKIALQVPAYCADQRSLQIVMNRIVSALAENPRNEAADETSYLEVAQWIRELAQSVEGAQGRLYWRRMLRQQALAGTYPEPGESSGQVSFQTVVPRGFAALPPAKREAWAALCWLRVARGMTGSPSLALGCLSDGRLDEGLHEVVGPLSRFIPLRGGEWGASAAEAVRRAAGALAEGRKWQELFLLEDLAGEAAAPEQASYFPYAFEYHQGTSGPGLLQIDDCDADAEPYLFLMRCQELDGNLRIQIRARHPAATLRRLDTLGERWLGVLQQSLEAAERSFDDIDVLTARERKAVPYRGRACEVEGTVHETLSRACRQFPDRTAVSGSGRELSFARLESLSNGLAALLPQRGPEAVIALQVERSPELIVALLAILKCGAAFLPVSVSAPEAYRRRLLKQSGARLLISDQPQRDAEDAGCDVLDLRTAIEVLQTAPPQSWTTPPVHPDQLAYVLFTSGSTGEPLAAAVSHRAVLNLWQGLNGAIPGLHETRRVGMNGPISFDTSIKQLVQLLSGHTIVVIPEDTRIDPAGLYAHLAAEKVEVVDFTPSHLELVLGVVSNPLSSLPEIVLLGGEAPRDQLWHRLNGTHAYNLYGLTECTVDSLVGRIDSALPAGTLGPPLDNVEVFVADRCRQPVPDDVTGELMISGMGLARGYYGAPAGTAERFIPNPLGNGSRAFRSGDLVERISDGSLRYRGRGESTVKIRGHRVTLAEVQTALESHRGVASAVVASRRVMDAEQLVAWVVPTPSYSQVVHGCSRYLVQGLSVAGLNQHETAFLHGEVFERNAYLRHGLFLPEDACVFDVGANIGLFSLRSHLSARGARIFAFEPNPDAHRCLLANVAIFGLSGHFLPLALGGKRGSAEFTCYRGFSLLSGFHADPQADLAVVREYNHQLLREKTGSAIDLMEELLADRFETHPFRCEVGTISELIRQHRVQRIDLLKVNVEKSEAEVLEGIEPEDWSRIQQVAMEVHDLDGRLGRITSLLKDHGFSVTVEKDWSLPDASSVNYYVYASRHPAGHRDPAPLPAVEDLPSPLTERGLRLALAAQWPEYQVPARVIVLDRLPLTDHGKVDQAALDALLLQARAVEGAPRTPLEAQILGEWQQILERRDVGIETHFFEAGGDSFSIMRLNLQLRRQLGLDMPVVDMLRHPNIRMLAQHVESLRQKTHG